jgi:predicted nucleotidyltransferase
VILAAASARVTLLARLDERVTDLVPSPAHVSVFGSFARGEAGPTSDIDLLVIADSETDLDDLREPLNALSDDVARWTGNHCQVLAITTGHVRELRNSGERIVDDWLADSILLAGSELAAVLRISRRSLGT